MKRQGSYHFFNWKKYTKPSWNLIDNSLESKTKKKWFTDLRGYWNRALAWNGLKYPAWSILLMNFDVPILWRHGVVVITTAQFHSTKPELRYCAGSNPARGVSEICDGEDLWQWSRLEIKLNALRRSTIPQKQFIIILIEESFNIKQ